MPIFEYTCGDCSTPYEILHKTVEREELIVCPACESRSYRKQFSRFAASISSTGSAPSCSDGSCAPGPSAPCFGGSCGLG